MKPLALTVSEPHSFQYELGTVYVAYRTTCFASEPAPSRLLDPRPRWENSSEIGRSLGISPRTVDQHIDTARAKLQAKTRLQAVAEAQAQGWLSRKAVGSTK